MTRRNDFDGRDKSVDANDAKAPSSDQGADAYDRPPGENGYSEQRASIPRDMTHQLGYRCAGADGEWGVYYPVTQLLLTKASSSLPRWEAIMAEERLHWVSTANEPAQLLPLIKHLLQIHGPLPSSGATTPKSKRHSRNTADHSRGSEQIGPIRTVYDAFTRWSRSQQFASDWPGMDEFRDFVEAHHVASFIAYCGSVPDAPSQDVEAGRRIHQLARRLAQGANDNEQGERDAFEAIMYLLRYAVPFESGQLPFVLSWLEALPQPIDWHNDNELIVELFILAREQFGHKPAKHGFWLCLWGDTHALLECFTLMRLGLMLDPEHLQVILPSFALIASCGACRVVPVLEFRQQGDVLQPLVAMADSTRYWARRERLRLTKDRVSKRAMECPMLSFRQRLIDIIHRIWSRASSLRFSHVFQELLMEIWPLLEQCYRPLLDGQTVDCPHCQALLADAGTRENLEWLVTEGKRRAKNLLPALEPHDEWLISDAGLSHTRNVLCNEGITNPIEPMTVKRAYFVQWIECPSKGQPLAYVSTARDQKGASNTGPYD